MAQSTCLVLLLASVCCVSLSSAQLVNTQRNGMDFIDTLTAPVLHQFFRSPFQLPSPLLLPSSPFSRNILARQPGVWSPLTMAPTTLPSSSWSVSSSRPLYSMWRPHFMAHHRPLYAPYSADLATTTRFQSLAMPSPSSASSSLGYMFGRPTPTTLASDSFVTPRAPLPEVYSSNYASNINNNNNENQQYPNYSTNSNKNEDTTRVLSESELSSFEQPSAASSTSAPVATGADAAAPAVATPVAAPTVSTPPVESSPAPVVEAANSSSPIVVIN